MIGPEFVADGTTLAIAEMLRGGTTCANENYFFGDVQAAVYKSTVSARWSARSSSISHRLGQDR